MGVALPTEFRVKNIQQTKEAKAQLEARREGGFHRRYRAFDKLEGVSRGPGRAGDFERKGGSGKSVVTGANATGSGRYGGAAAMSGGSFNSNFNQHRREWSVTMRNHDGDGGAARVGTLDGTFSSNGTAGHTSRDYPARG